MNIITLKLAKHSLTYTIKIKNENCLNKFNVTD